MSDNGSDAPVERRQIALVADYLAARDLKEATAAAAKKASQDADTAEQRVLDFYAEHGVKSVRNADGRLVSLTRTLRARPKAGSEELLVAALHDEGFDDLIKERVLPQTLTAWVRERDEHGEIIPEQVQAVMEVAEMFGLSVRKG